MVGMEPIFAYRGRQLTKADVTFIGELIAAQPDASRRGLSLALCAAWNWVQPNGNPRDMVCRGLLLGLERAGHITLPVARWSPLAARQRRTPPRLEIDATPVRGRLGELGALEFRQVRRSAEESLFDSLIETHHYLGYAAGRAAPEVPGVRRLAAAGVLCLELGATPPGAAGSVPGWSVAARRSNVHLVAYNSRFLILPWVEVEHLASHLLGRMARLLPADWERLYGHPVYFAETFTVSDPVPWDVLPGGQLDLSGADDRAGRGRSRRIGRIGR